MECSEMEQAGDSGVEMGEEVENFSCKHYKRKCKFVTPCCDGLYRCRFCHDEEQGHTLRRDDVTEVECSQCGQRQDVREYCLKCNLKFGQYFCFDCKLYDDEDKQQFHCSGCGICRVGGRDNYFHCHRCDMCLPNHLENKHKCVEKVSRSNCPVCQEDIHTSRIPSQIPPCNHLIHKSCFDEMLSNGHYACPVCGVSMMDMTDVWKIYDKEILETPMPAEYLDLCAAIQCKDCFKPSLSRFHVLGMKCVECGSFNTVRDKGPLVRQEGSTPTSPSLVIEHDMLDLAIAADSSSDTESTESITSPTLPSLPSLTPLTSPEPMQEENLQSPDLPISPPETPTREEQMVPRVARLTRSGTSQPGTSSMSTSVSLTPEPSPMRETLVRRESNIGPGVSRRISFSEDSGEGSMTDK